LGAELHSDETVRSWRVRGRDVIVETDRSNYTTERLIIAAGPWSSQLLGGLGLRLEVRRKPLYWFAPRNDVYSADRGCPAFLYDLPQGCYYGVPQIDPLGIKVALHTGGEIVRDPLTVNREVDPADQKRVADFVSEYLPDATTECTGHVVCMYTMTPDGHFVVDRHPEHPQVAYAAGLSGHGFKFTAALGELLTRWVVDGEPGLPIEFLAHDRPALRASATN
jgi:glycine/D-amino acid oxidase-like deaminating enzyme